MPIAKAVFDETDPCTAEDLIHLLDAMPMSVTKLERRPPWTDAVQHYSQMVAAAVPSATDKLAWLTDQIAEGLASVPLGNDPTHGDFHEGQVHVSGGRIVGSGANVQWDLSGVGKGTYTITTGVDDGCGVCGKTETKTVTVEECSDCVQICSCPTLMVSGPAGTTDPGATMTFTLSGAGSNSVNWSVSAGTIESGQGTSSITVRAPADGSVSNITATAEVGGLDPNCGCTTTASESAPVAPKPTATLIDEFGKAPDDDVKARVDNFYIQLNNNPSAQGYIINYGNAAQIKKRKAQIMKAINFRKYDVNRVTFVDGGDTGAGESTKFWLVPAGADAPRP